MSQSTESRLLDLMEEWRNATPEERTAMIDKLQAEDPGLCGELMKMVRFDAEVDGAAAIDEVPSTCPPGPGEAVPDAAAIAAALGRPAIDGYDFLEELGKGGMGVVWKARERVLGRIVAIKVINGLPDKVKCDRFVQEARAMASLGKHEHIVAIHKYDIVVGKDRSSFPYLSMEYIEGGKSLRNSVGLRRPEPADVVRLMLMVAEAIEHAHAKGVLHRDLKPDNVLIAPWTDKLPSPNWQWGKPKLADFGLAYLRGSAALTACGAVLGTPQYMAPEQAEPEKVGAAADVYGLGGIFYWLLTGDDPFSGEDAWAIVEQVKMTRPPPPKATYTAIPGELAALCMNCLAKAPAERPTVEALIHKLREYLDRAERPPSLSLPAGVVEELKASFKVAKGRVQITLDYPGSLEAGAMLLQAIMNAIGCRPCEIRSGCVRFTFDLTAEEASRLLDRVNRGEFRALGVTGAWYTNEEPDFDLPRVHIDAPGLWSRKPKPPIIDRPEPLPESEVLDQVALKAKWIAERRASKARECAPSPDEPRPAPDAAPTPPPGEPWQQMALTPGLIRIAPGKVFRFEADKTVSNEQASALLSLVAQKHIPLYELDLSFCKLVTEACLARLPELPARSPSPCTTRRQGRVRRSTSPCRSNTWRKRTSLQANRWPRRSTPGS